MKLLKKNEKRKDKTESLVAKQKTWAEVIGKNCLLKGAGLRDSINPCHLKCCLCL